MGYMKIENLYKNQEVLKYDPLWVMEKIHGTSTHIHWDLAGVSYFHGGASKDGFKAIFNHELLKHKFAMHFPSSTITIYGEGYGGKVQKMTHVYGKELRFIAFDVKVNGEWKDLPIAHNICEVLGLDFVPYKLVPPTLEVLNELRDAPSVLSSRLGISNNGMREGIVIKPFHETVNEHGNRVIAKHKQQWASENKSTREVDPTKKTLYKNAVDIANEWVVPMRLIHVLDKIGNPIDITATRKVVEAVIDDVIAEAGDEVENTAINRREIGKLAARLYKEYIQEKLLEGATNG